MACKPDCHGAPNTRMKLTRRPSRSLGSLASSLGAQLMRHPLGSPKSHYVSIAILLLSIACASSPSVGEKPWHQSPPLSSSWSQAYAVVEWSAVQKLRAGMTETECEALLHVPVTFWAVNTIVFTTDPQGVKYEVALKTSDGKIEDISYKRRAA